MKLPKKVEVKKTVKALPPVAVKSNGKLVSHFYKNPLVRESPLFVANLRAKDYTKQAISAGKLPRNLACVLTVGEHGHSVGLVSVKGTMADLSNGHLFDLSGVKKQEIIPVSKIRAYAKKNGKLHTVLIGKKKVKYVGYIIGSMSNMYVAFVSKDDGEFSTTLETRTLPGGKNEDRVFSLVK